MSDIYLTLKSVRVKSCKHCRCGWMTQKSGEGGGMPMLSKDRSFQEFCPNIEHVMPFCAAWQS